MLRVVVFYFCLIFNIWIVGMHFCFMCLLCCLHLYFCIFLLFEFHIFLNVWLCFFIIFYYFKLLLFFMIDCFWFCNVNNEFLHFAFFNFFFRFMFFLFNIVFVYLHIFILFQWIIVVFCISFYFFVFSCVCISFFFLIVFFTQYFFNWNAPWCEFQLFPLTHHFINWIVLNEDDSYFEFLIEINDTNDHATAQLSITHKQRNVKSTRRLRRNRTWTS